MGLRGPKGKTLEEHQRDGTFRKDRHKHLLLIEKVEKVAESQPEVVVEEPDDLDGEELVIWKELMAVLGDRSDGMGQSVVKDFAWWITELRRVQARIRKADPESAKYALMMKSALIVSAKVSEYAILFRMTPTDDKVLERRLAVLMKQAVNSPGGQPAAGGVNGARVKARPQTTLDQQGAPK